MSHRHHLRKSSACMAAALLTLASGASAQSTVDTSSWMASVSSDLRLSELAVPGTHDSGAYDPPYGRTWAQNQTLDIYEQLEAGVRSLDLRLMERFGTCFLAHGVVRMDVTCEFALSEVARFLSEHGSETVLVGLQKNDHRPASDETISELLAAEDLPLWDGNCCDEADPHCDLNAKIPELGCVRGQMVILTSGFAVEGGLEKTSDLVKGDPDWEASQSELGWLWGKKEWWINHSLDYPGRATHAAFVWHAITAASNNVTPRYAATGQHDWYTRRTGDCGSSLCEFEGFNPLTIELVRSLDEQVVGVFAADFPDDTLIRTIIQANDLFIPLSTP